MLDIGLIGHMTKPHDHAFHFIHKFGRNPAVGTTEEDVWNYGGEETLLSAGATMYASCDDNVNGVGQVLLVDGLDENWNHQNGIVTLAGYSQEAVTKIDGSAALWTRIHRSYQISAAPDPVGDVYIAELDGTISTGIPGDATKVHALIQYTNAPQQTEKAMYTVPADHEAFITAFGCEMLQSTGSARQVEVSVEVADLAYDASVISPAWAPRRRVHTHAISTSSISENAEFDVPIRVDELTNIHVRAVATASSSVISDIHIVLRHKGLET